MSIHQADSFCPENRKDWRIWLERNHDKKDGVWLIMYKKSSSNPNLDWSEAVDEALCFGWIDSLKKSIDEEKFRQYFSKRKDKSNWSRINKNKVEKLIAKKRMRPAGYQSIKIAKENGSWTIMDEVEDGIIPNDLEEAFQKNKGSKDFYLTLSPSFRKSILYWVMSAKRPETRQKRIHEIVTKAAKELKPNIF